VACCDVSTEAPSRAPEEPAIEAAAPQLPRPPSEEGPDLGRWPEGIRDRLAGGQRVGRDQLPLGDRPEQRTVRGVRGVQLRKPDELRRVIDAEQSDLNSGVIGSHLGAPIRSVRYLNDSIVPDVRYQRNMDCFSG
jgi:hypothetical protein